ncbi:hypothetical protein AIG12_02780 [Salmonella enterica subsp. enterica serovar Enteritidis]|nr:hypothetical protein [Salmonella enterica]EBL5447297.1 hypothetical protein [Salmonella enterica subsp. enterica serovar Enteritidis]EAN8017706.1 hypothetical protein [Salmonella enterica]EAN9507416.1 hypothetical protein [Salmonella enterica]EAO1014573.1 hypothetical protein [Salmonella enterica]
MTHCCRMALMSANSVMRQPAGRRGRSCHHPAKISHATPTPLRSSATLKSIENSHILYG